uniref:DNA primase small subunit n=1 Tax=Aplanochytrium stocchinoi TaxID=215587 RepID=A0A7S3V2S5_9STRA
MIPSTEIQNRLRSAWEKDMDTVTSAKRWAQLKATVKDAAKKSKAKDAKQAEKLELCIYSILILHTYPRLDVNVSTHRNHLLKSPFVAHPKTGNICVPILDIANCDKFDPDGVPNLKDLAEEINTSPVAEQKDDAMDVSETDKPNKKQKIEAYQRTSLKPYIDGFEKKFLKGLYKTIREGFKKISIENQEKAAMVGDW